MDVYIYIYIGFAMSAIAYVEGQINVSLGYFYGKRFPLFFSPFSLYDTYKRSGEYNL